MSKNRKRMTGASILEYVLVMAVCVIVFVPILIPGTGDGKMGKLYEEVRWAFRRAIVFISLPLL